MAVKIKVRNWYRTTTDDGKEKYHHAVVTVPNGVAIAVKEGTLRVLNTKGELIWCSNNLSWRTAEVIEQTQDVKFEQMAEDDPAKDFV